MSIKIGDVARKERRDTAANWASNNPVPLEGEWCIETDTGNVKLGDGVSTYNLIGYHIRRPDPPYDISTANTVIALPAITGLVQRLSYYWTGGDGSNTFSFTVSDAATINGDLATVWIGEGEGHIEIESDGTNWRVKDYDDSGSNANGEWEKEITGKLVNYGEYTGSSASAVNKTLPKNVVTISKTRVITSNKAGSSNIYTSAFLSDVSNVSLLSSLTGVSNVITWTAIGKWK